MTDETTDTRNVCVRGEFMAKIQVCLRTFKFFRSQTLISCVYLDCVVHGQSNKSHIKVSALQASVKETIPLTDSSRLASLAKAKIS